MYHRDIKPKNTVITLTPTPTIPATSAPSLAIIDFAMASILPLSSPPPSPSCGTPYYKAP